jgi:hypothetical protein
MQVRCVAECICIEESHRMYVWIVRMLADMEPRYNLSFLHLIFADQGLTQKILVDLDIATTCILRCDYYHQINEVWPHTFGTHLFQKTGVIWTECCWGQRKNGVFRTHPPRPFFFMMPRNSPLWKESTRTFPILPVGSSRRLRAIFFFMVPFLPNKTIPAWRLI